MKNRIVSKLIPFVIFFMIQILLPSCLTTKIISQSEIPESHKYHYIIHGHNVKFHLENARITGNIIEGTVSFKHISRNKSINVFPKSDNDLVIDKSNVMRLPLNKVSDLELIRISPFRTAALGLAVLITCDLIYALADSGVYHINHP